MVLQNVNSLSQFESDRGTTMQSSILPSSGLDQSKIKSLLLQGWRNRWNAQQFTTQLKQNGALANSLEDQHTLARILLQQATVGRQPVQLFIEYLDHLLSAGTIDPGSAIESIVEFGKVENTQITLAMLDLLLSLEGRLLCFGPERECFKLATSLSKLVCFLFACLEHHLNWLSDNLSNFNSVKTQNTLLIEKCCRLLLWLIKDLFLFSLFFLGLVDHCSTKSLSSIRFIEVLNLFETILKNQPQQKQFATYYKVVCTFVQHLNEFNPNLIARQQLMAEIDNFTNQHASFSMVGYPQSDNDNKSLNMTEKLTENLKELTEQRQSKKQQLHQQYKNDFNDDSMTSFNCALVFGVILNPIASPQTLAKRLYMFAIINNLPFYHVCCELIKCSFVCMLDSINLDSQFTTKKDITLQTNPQRRFLQQLKIESVALKSVASPRYIRWVTFTYYGISQIFKCLKQILKKEHSLELNLEKSLTQLASYTPLLELIDFKSNCDCFEMLLKEFVKNALIGEETKDRLLKVKTERSQFYCSNLGKGSEQQKLKPPDYAKQHSILATFQAESLSQKLLRSLESYQQNPEVVYGLLIHINPSKSLNLILDALVFTDKLGQLCQKLISLNEANRHSAGENFKQAQTRAHFFDLTFLILFSITQSFGRVTILNALQAESGGAVKPEEQQRQETSSPIKRESNNKLDQPLENSFFVQICSDFVADHLSKSSSEEKFLRQMDSKKVDQLLTQLWVDNFDMQLVKWNEVFINSVGVFREAFNAFLTGGISFDKLTYLIQNMVKRYCSIGPMISLYLINRMQVMSIAEREKAVSILNFIVETSNFSVFFNTSATNKPSGSGGTSSSSASTTNSNDSLGNFLKERYNFMKYIVERLLQENIPPSLLNDSNNVNNRLKLTRQPQPPLLDVLKHTFSYSVKKNWLDNDAIFTFNHLLLTGGSNWFVDKLVHLLLFDCDNTELSNATELLCGLCLLDVQQCCLSLLDNVLPQRLISARDQHVLVEPKLRSLAKLVAATIYANLYRNSSERSRLSHAYSFDDFYEDDDRTSKMIRTTESTFSQVSYGAINQLLENIKGTPAQFLFDNDRVNQLSIFDVSISKVFRLLCSVLQDRQLSQRSCFPLVLLQQLLLMSKNDQQVLQNNQNYEMAIKVQQPNEKIVENVSIRNDIPRIVSKAVDSDLHKILKFLPFDVITGLIKLQPENVSFEFLLSICNLQSQQSRQQAASALCQLARAKKLFVINCH